MKGYPSYKESPVAWIKKVPDHWDFMRGKDLYEKMQRPVRDTDEVVTCFRDGTVTLRKNRRTTGFTESLKEIGYQGVRKGDLVIHVMDAFAGAIGVSDSDGKGTPVYNVCQAKMNSNNHYYAYLLREMARAGFIQSLYRGIRERSSDFRFEVFGVQFYPVPPRAEQDQIVLFLDWKVSEINRLIAIKKKKVSEYRELRKAVFDQGILHGFNKSNSKESGVYWLGKIPDTWDVLSLKRISKVNATVADTVNKMDASDLVTFLPMENVSETGIVDCSVKKPLYEVRSGFSSFAKGDVVVAKITPCFENGKGACLDDLDTDIGFGTTEFINLRPSSRVLSKYLYMITMTRPFRMLGEEVMTGSAGQKRVPVNYIKNFTLGIPSVEEQSQILKEIEKRIARIDKAIDAESEGIKCLQELKARIISDVVTGKIDIRDVDIPEYETIDEDIEDNTEGIDREEETEEV